MAKRIQIEIDPRLSTEVLAEWRDKLLVVQRGKSGLARKLRLRDIRTVDAINAELLRRASVTA